MRHEKENLKRGSHATHAQRFGNDLERSRQLSRKFSINFQIYIRAAFCRSHSDFSRECVAHFGQREVRTQVNSRRTRENFHRTEIAHADNVKLSVREFCVGRDLHTAAEVTRVGDDEIRH